MKNFNCNKKLKKPSNNNNFSKLLPLALMDLHLMLPPPPTRLKHQQAPPTRKPPQFLRQMNFRVNLRQLLSLKFHLTTPTPKNPPTIMLKRMTPQITQPRGGKLALITSINFPNRNFLMNLFNMLFQLFFISKFLPAMTNALFFIIAIAMLRFNVNFKIFHLH